MMLGAFGITTHRIRELIKWFNDAMNARRIGDNNLSNKITYQMV